MCIFSYRIVGVAACFVDKNLSFQSGMWCVFKYFLTCVVYLQRLRSPSDTMTDFCKCNFGFYVYKLPEDDYEAAWYVS